MESRPSVTLAMTVHQPTERLAELAAAQLPALASCYAALVAYCSRETHATLLALLRRVGAAVHVDGAQSEGIHRIGEVRRRAIRAGLEAGTPHLQMCDFDRAIHWAAHYPQELEAVIADIPNYDLLVLGRTARAWATHPAYQAETEPLFNRVFALVTGLAWDIGAGSRGLSRRAAQTLLEISREPTVGIDAEWPLLLLAQQPRKGGEPAPDGGWRVGHRPCEGLEFETADRFGPEIEAAGSYSAWEAQMSGDPQRWVFRLQLALLIAETALRYGALAQGD